VILPFIWIFNPQLLLIDIHGWWELCRVVLACTLAMLIFSALTMNWFRVRSRWWENLLLAMAVLLLFRPDLFMDQLSPEYRAEPAAKVYDVARAVPDHDRLVMVIRGTNIEGDDITKTVAIGLGAAGEDGRRRLSQSGLQLMTLGDRVQIGAVRFGSRAQKAGLEQGWDVVSLQVPADRPTPHWFYLPALLLIGGVWLSQGARMRRGAVMSGAR
jgi:hypothetical protein